MDLDSSASETKEISQENILDQKIVNTAGSGPNFKLLRVLGGHSRSISSLKFSPDGAYLASCGTSAYALVWTCS
jgi:WD40 repeat protein